MLLTVQGAARWAGTLVQCFMGDRELSGQCDWSIVSSVRGRGGTGICKECGWYPEQLMESSVDGFRNWSSVLRAVGNLWRVLGRGESIPGACGVLT